MLRHVVVTSNCFQHMYWTCDCDDVEVIKVDEIEIMKEVKWSDTLWRFACGDVLIVC